MLRRMLGIGCVIFIVSAMAFAKTPASKPAAASGPAKDVLSGPYWGSLVRELKLNEDEQAKLREKVQAKRGALDVFDQSKDGKELIQLTRDHKAAVIAKQTGQAKSLLKKIKPLQARRNQIADEKQTEIMAMFDKDQLNTWTGYQLYVSLNRHFTKADPTDEQEKELRKLADQAGPDLAKIDFKDRKARENFRADMVLKARKEIKWTPKQLFSLDEGGKAGRSKTSASAPAEEDNS